MEILVSNFVSISDEKDTSSCQKRRGSMRSSWLHDIYIISAAPTLSKTWKKENNNKRKKGKRFTPSKMDLLLLGVASAVP